MLKLKSTLLEENRLEKNKHIVQLGDAKSYQLGKRLIEEYQSFLADLSLQELNHEVEYLLEQIDLSTYDREAFWRLDAVMHLLENRSSTGAAKLIRKIREEVYDRVRSIYKL
jgi:hypothetical protein